MGFLIFGDIFKSFFLFILNCTPNFINTFKIFSKCFGTILFIVSTLLVIAAATKYVPASILSGIILYLIPFRFLTPLIINDLFLSKFILAPAFFKKLIKSMTSGSIAMLLILVLLFDRHEFKIAVSVAPTEIFANV